MRKTHWCCWSEECEKARRPGLARRSIWPQLPARLASLRAWVRRPASAHPQTLREFRLTDKRTRHAWDWTPSDRESSLRCGVLHRDPVRGGSDEGPSEDATRTPGAPLHVSLSGCPIALRAAG